MGQHANNISLPFNLFNIMDGLTIQALNQCLKCTSNQVYIDKLLPTIKIISDLNNVDMSIAEIFYEKMTLKSEMFDNNKIKQYTEIITFINKNQAHLPIDKKKMVIEFFDKLIKHWNTYQLDPDSSLIGLSPTESIVNKLSTESSSNEITTMLSNKDIEKLILKLDTSDGGGGTGSNDFTSKIIKWSSIENPLDLMKQIRHYASLFRGIDKLKKGDIVIVRFTTSNLQQQQQATTSNLPNGTSPNLNSTTPTPSNNIHYTGIIGNNNNNNNSTPSLSNNLSTNNLNSLQARSYFSKTKIIPNRVSSSFKKSMQSIPIITLDEYCKKNIKPIINFSTSSSWASSAAAVAAAANNNSNGNGNGLNVTRFFNQKSQYARFSGERIGNYLICYFSPEEKEGVAVPLDSVLILNKTIMEKIKEKDKSFLKRIIHQPSDDFNKELVHKVKECTVRYLGQMGIDLRFVQLETINLPPNLFSLKKIKQMNEKLRLILSDSQHPLYLDLEDRINNEINSFLLSINTRQFFMPSYGNTISEIKENHPLYIAKSKVNQTYGEIEMAIDKFQAEKLYYLNNTRKDEISDWWLKRVDQRSNDFLVKRGFKLDALPDNYIEQPPNNLNDIYLNYHIVKQILKPQSTTSTTPNTITVTTLVPPPSSSSSATSSSQQQPPPLSTSPGRDKESPTITHRKRSTSGGNTPRPSTPTQQQPQQIVEQLTFSPLELIKELQDEIYPVIHDFVKKCKIIFCDQFGLDKFTDSESMKKVLQEKKIIMEPTLYEQFENLLSDLDYLKEMERIEFLQVQDKDASFHIVPISGLTISVFARYENELNTVIELWSTDQNYYNNNFGNNNKQSVIQQSPINNTTSFTVASDDTFTDLPLNSNSSRSGYQYGNGGEESPLSLTITTKPSMVYNTASTTTTTINTTSVTITNNVKEEKSQLIESILTENPSLVEETLKMIQLENDLDGVKEIINEKDSNGWAAIHYACSIGNAEICLLLLNVQGIDVHLMNKQGGSPLHFIVRHQCTKKRKEVINKMIKLGIDINIGSKNGETPLHSTSLRGNVDTVLFLLEKGANVNAVTTNMETALHYAVTKDKLDIIRVLIGFGAKIDVCSKRGTPLELAKHLKNFEVIKLLEIYNSMKK